MIIERTNNIRLEESFFKRDALEVAPALIGKVLVRKFDTGEIKKYRIVETEAYCGEEDLGCHASKGRTPRTEVMYKSGGKIYVYLIYGMYWLLNIVTGAENNPEAVLIRGVTDLIGPGKIGKELNLDKTFYGEDISTSSRIWIEDDGSKLKINTGFRVGIEYAGKEWAEKPWRYFVV